ncbi:MAG TPA: HD domain-containing phosphohydrolase [Gemmatimonadaceae bacterium]|nr:HD domain-containing phosphohydrolase [Gemmatimonadaceae bacterium]
MTASHLQEASGELHSGAKMPESAISHRCLVVDDEPRLRQALVRLMQGDGFTCLEAGSGVEALAVLKNEPVALVLSDMRMPAMDGQELLRQLRVGYPDVAVVMITAVAEVEVAVACLSLGAMDYITKPFVFEEVRARVAQALEKRRLLADNRDYQERLEVRVKAQAERLETLFLASIQSLADALELKDPYTRGHSVRVSQYGVAIARAMGLSPTLTAQIELGGHLHDVGKIGVREEVLRKAGPLTTEEYEHIMTHPVLGWRILQPLLGENLVALNIVRSHHERMDGKGVPDRYAGDEIPREARIIAVADAFDAMMSKRPYRNGLTFTEAMAELRRVEGPQFDPEVVDAFFEVARSDSFVPGSGSESESIKLRAPKR